MLHQEAGRALGPGLITGAADDDPSGIAPDLVEETEFGQIPRISSTGVTPFAAYSRGSGSLAEADGRPYLGIEIRQDQIGDPAGQTVWAERLARIGNEVALKLGD